MKIHWEIFGGLVNVFLFIEILAIRNLAIRNWVLNKILIFGNSGSGKSTLAKRLAEAKKLAHLDLDVLAWQPTNSLEGKPPERKPLSASGKEISKFIGANKNWVIEGCYTDLLELVVADANEIIFLNLPIEACVANAKARPWEPHKYESKQAQDENLTMLIHWIEQYQERTDTFSYEAHYRFYQQFNGKKRMLTSNE